MERAFLKCLKNFLSKKYSYIIVGDRGFGNERIVNCCKKFGYEYLLIINPAIKVECEAKEIFLSDIKGDKSLELKIISWKRDIRSCLVKPKVMQKVDQIGRVVLV